MSDTYPTSPDRVVRLMAGVRDIDEHYNELRADRALRVLRLAGFNLDDDQELAVRAAVGFVTK